MNPEIITHDQIAKMLEQAVITQDFSLKDSLGDTIGEKYESLYLKMIDVSKELGLPMIIAGRDVCSIFESCTAGLTQRLTPHEPGVHELGVVNWRWRLILDTDLPNDVLIIHDGKTAVLKVKWD